jgi:iron complex transport system substrate-binding protein
MRIASLSPAATEILFALGCQRQIVCVDQFSNWPAEAKNIAHVMGHQTVDSEKLRTHLPDLILTATVIQRQLAADLRAAGFSVLHQDPRTLRDVESCMREIAVFLDKQEEGEALCLTFRSLLNDVKKKAALLPRRPRVYVEEWHDPPMASGNWVPELVRIAGGDPFPIPPGELSRSVTFEEVRGFDPDLIVISWCGAGSLADPNLLLDRSGWSNLRAVQTKKVRVIDDAFLNRPGPRLPEGAQRLYGWLFELTH